MVRAVLLGFLMLGVGTVRADPYCSCNYEYVPARYSNTQAGDVVGHHNPNSLVFLLVSQMGENTNHVQSIFDSGGARVTQQHFDANTIRMNSCSTPLNWDDLKATQPGVHNGVIADSDEGLHSVFGNSTVLERGGSMVAGCYAPYEPYHLHGFVERAYNSMCAQMLVDSCGAPGVARSYSPTQVVDGANTLFNGVFQKCMDQSLPWYYFLRCYSETQTSICVKAANQVLNQVLWNNSPCATDYHYNCGKNPSGQLPTVSGPVSPEQIFVTGMAQGLRTHVATVEPGHYACPARCQMQCAAAPAAVGAYNYSAYSAGANDYYCGYYLYNYGNDMGYCARAVSDAASAGIHTVATGTCAAGTYYNYLAGYYDYLCRLYEYYGYGFNYSGYCSAADSLVAQGGCTSCDQCRPSCSGKTCGQGDGCGGTCYAGSGCCTPSCSGKICGQGDGCGGICYAGSGCSCTPSCSGKTCGQGDDCGGICYAGSGCCTPSCSGKTCGQSDGCGGTCQAGSGCTSPISQLYPATGWVDGYNNQHVWGWACDPDYPTESNRVDFYTWNWQGLGSVGAYGSSSQAIANACGGGYAHYFDFWPAGGLASGTHFWAWSIDLPYATPGNDNRAIGGSGSVGNGTEFIIP